MPSLLENETEVAERGESPAPGRRRGLKNVSVRPTARELDALHARAASFGFKSLSKYLIECGLSRGVMIESAERERVERLLFEARMIGRNLNQLARWANAGGRGLSRDRVERAAEEAARVISEIGEVFAKR